MHIAGRADGRSYMRRRCNLRNVRSPCRYVVICACLRARITRLLCAPCGLRNHREYDSHRMSTLPCTRLRAKKIFPFRIPSSRGYRRFNVADRLPSFIPIIAPHSLNDRERNIITFETRRAKLNARNENSEFFKHTHM